MKISIIISTYNRVNLLEKCLISLIKQTFNKNKFEIIIVDNNSSDKTKLFVNQFIENHPKYNFYYFNENKQGISFARNKGAFLAKGEYLAFIDDDAYAKSNWIEEIIKSFENKNTDVVGGPIIPYFEKDPPQWFVNHFEIRNWGKKSRYLSKIESKLGFSGSNFSIKKKIFEHENGFSTNFGMKDKKISLGEETNLFRIINKKNKKFFYNKNALVFHYTPERNWKLSYILKRSFAAGKTKNLIEEPNFFKIFKKLGLLCINMILIPFDFLKKNKNIQFKTIFFKRLQKIASNIGYIIGNN